MRRGRACARGLASSVGRALDAKCQGRRFEPCLGHCFLLLLHILYLATAGRVVAILANPQDWPFNSITLCFIYDHSRKVAHHISEFSPTSSLRLLVTP